MNINPPGLCNNWGYQRWQLIDIRHLLDGSLQAMVADTLGQLPALNARLNEAVSRERQTGMQMVKSVLERIGEAK